MTTTVTRTFQAWRTGAGADPRRDERTASILGIALGVSFTICFLTGIYSHLAQHPPSWFTLPASPAGLYRVTQGLHVATGIATIPLLLAKLWAVFPHLLQLPPVRSVPHLLERLSLLPLVGGAVFQLFSGTANIFLWYPLPFFFPAAHHWVAWIVMGAMAVHLGAKIPVVRRALSSTWAGPADHDAPRLLDEPFDGDPDAGRDRRRFLVLVGSSAALLTAVTVGQTVRPLQRLALLAPRRPDVGPQGFPVNKTATEAGVGPEDRAAYRLVVTGAVATELELTLDDLRAMPQHEATLPIACVEGWSASKRWRGVRLADLLALAGAATGAAVTVRSMEGEGLYAQSDVNGTQATAPDTLLALQVEGEDLHPDHGAPARLIAPNRPGVMQTKWVDRVEVR